MSACNLGVDKREVKDMILDGQKLIPPNYTHTNRNNVDALHKVRPKFSKKNFEILIFKNPG